VQYRGKWHISKDPTGTLAVQSPRDLEQYGFQGWIPPEAGTDESATVFGGGDTNYDAQYAAQAADFLKKANPYSQKPFALFVCLANPHDLMGYPNTWNQPSYSDIDAFKGADNYGKDYPECFDQGIDLPLTAQESPLGNFKPPAQARSTLMWASGIGTLLSHEEQLNYVNFYAYLHRVSDRHIGTVLDALESNRGLRNKTIVFGLSDHGEMGLAHGGMREKAYNAYEETIHVPLVVSNPALFPRAVRTQALASLIDLMPTVAALAGVRNQGNGRSWGPTSRLSSKMPQPTPRIPPARFKKTSTSPRMRLSARRLWDSPAHPLPARSRLEGRRVLRPGGGWQHRFMSFTTWPATRSKRTTWATPTTPLITGQTSWPR
jgi:arylsulfatase A-like enzyme